jgi:hypothetical protein
MPLSPSPSPPPPSGLLPAGGVLAPVVGGVAHAGLPAQPPRHRTPGQLLRRNTPHHAPHPTMFPLSLTQLRPDDPSLVPYRTNPALTILPACVCAVCLTGPEASEHPAGRVPAAEPQAVRFGNGGAVRQQPGPHRPQHRLPGLHVRRAPCPLIQPRYHKTWIMTSLSLLGLPVTSTPPSLVLFKGRPRSRGRSARVASWSPPLTPAPAPASPPHAAPSVSPVT